METLMTKIFDKSKSKLDQSDAFMKYFGKEHTWSEIKKNHELADGRISVDGEISTTFQEFFDNEGEIDDNDMFLAQYIDAFDHDIEGSPPYISYIHKGENIRAEIYFTK